MVLGMTTTIETMKLTAQETVDELFREEQIPFQLSAREVEGIGLEEYIVRFHDSRLRSVDVSCREGQSFKENLRHSLLSRVSRLTGPLKYRAAS
jgi:hypothetical protein